MSRPIPIATAVDLPNQGIAPVIAPMEMDDAGKFDGEEPEKQLEAEERVGVEGVIHEEAMPEGPTVTRWEEWA